MAPGFVTGRVSFVLLHGLPGKRSVVTSVGSSIPTGPNRLLESALNSGLSPSTQQCPCTTARRWLESIYGCDGPIGSRQHPPKESEKCHVFASHLGNLCQLQAAWDSHPVTFQCKEPLYEHHVWVFRRSACMPTEQSTLLGSDRHEYL